MSKTHIMSIAEDGSIRCLWTDAIELSALGKLDVKRASTIEFNEVTQLWEVRFTSEPERVVYCAESRAMCIAYEVTILQKQL